jgi:hypothetical protein
MPAQTRPYKPALSRDLIRRTARPLAVWGFIAALVFVLFWPAMWVDPAGALMKVFGEAVNYAEAGHASPVFFNGRIFEDGRLGLDTFYFYPLVYVWRSTPIVLSGLVIALVGFFRKEKPFDRDRSRQAALGLLLLAVAFTALITLSDKKFDRYLIPAFAPLDLLAGMGWAWVAWKWMTLLTRMAARLAARRHGEGSRSPPSPSPSRQPALCPLSLTTSRTTTPWRVAAGERPR